MQAKILNLLRDLQAARGIAYLFITHSTVGGDYMADPVAARRAGKIVEQGACEAVLNQPQDAYTRRLIESVPRLLTPS